MNPALKAWYYVQYLAFRLLLFLIGVVPLRAALGLTALLARIGFVILRNRRREAIANVLQSSITDDPKEAKRIASESFRTFLLTVVEGLIARKRMNADNWQDFVSLNLDDESRELLTVPGEGVVVATAHVGNWEILARAVSMAKPLRAIYRPLHNPYVDASVSEDRQGENLTMIAKYDDDPMRFFRPLSEGEILAIMMDQHASNGIYVDFFGRPAKTTTSAAMLHLVTKCPLLIAYAIRTGPLKYELRASPPIRFERSGDRKADVHAITQTLTRGIEDIARAHPELYMWGHRRWK